MDPDKVYWEYKWENKDDADIYGPYQSEQMENWTNQDYFQDGVWVRKVGSGQNFYTSKRIDFSLYVWALEQLYSKPVENDHALAAANTL